ncbi:MAG: response regulator [Chlorobium sp.]|uniref:ATP-binding response regulator n=1 Tax=Chlorobium sp. TaxID=1095 RepID=UPI0025C0CA2E|nr:response regulator [Chlorobium sp.]MCF8383557.1 response regulator [Chlorobium sp.]
MTSRHTPKPSLLKKGVEFLRKDYDRNEFTIDMARFVGFWAHPLYYVIWTVILPQPFESPALRFASAIAFIPLFFAKRYPVRLKPWVNLYWYLWLTLTLPVVFTYLTLMNNFSGMWLICETMMLLVFIIFIPNYFLLTFLLASGISIAYAGFFFSTGTHLIVTTEIIEYLLPLPMAILLGLLSGFTIKKGEMAQERNRVLQSLAGSIAHEMRNPLGQIRHCLNSIQNQLPHFHPERRAEPLKKEELDTLYDKVAHGQMAVKRGIQVVDMVLGEIREKPIDPESFTYLSAERVIRKALDEYGYESEHERERVHLDAGETFIFRINETLFVFVLFNLLKNALFYLKSHPQSEITVRLAKGVPHNCLFFRDTGPGISKDDLPHIFESFHTRGKSNGTGLGLAYCKRVMKAFGGNIRCDSVQGKYTEFTLLFPSVESGTLDEYNARTIADALPDFKGKRLLLVDDESIYRMTVKKYLLPLHIDIHEAANGREALVLAAGNYYDLIIMDLNMPLMNGYEAVERMRRGEAGEDARATPVIAHSAEPAYIAQAMSEKAGMQALISKPCSQAELINALRATLYSVPYGKSVSGKLEGKRVLLVDDSALNRKLLALSLKDAGLQVTVSGNGEESWTILQKQPFDLLITDIRMQGMDGLELTRRIRATTESGLRRLPVVGLSGAAEEEAAARAAGMDEFRLKTDNPNLLLASIGKLLASGSTAHPDTAAETPAASAAITASYGFTPAETENLIKMFLDEFSDTPECMRLALANNDIDSLRQQAHKLKGSSAMLGIEPLRQASEKLERSCRSGRSEDLDTQVEKIGAALDEFAGKSR